MAKAAGNSYSPNLRPPRQSSTLLTRGACGNVSYGGTRNPPRVSKERVLETLRLKLRAPYFYPDYVF